MDGLLLFAHGARDPAWAGPFEAAARHIQTQQPALPIALAYLEFLTPAIDEAAQSLVDRGCTHLHVIPMFLGASGHVRRDVPPLVERLQAQWEGRVTLTLHAAIGEQAIVSQAMGDAALALARITPLAAKA